MEVVHTSEAQCLIHASGPSPGFCEGAVLHIRQQLLITNLSLNSNNLPLLHMTSYQKWQISVKIRPTSNSSSKNCTLVQ